MRRPSSPLLVSLGLLGTLGLGCHASSVPAATQLMPGFGASGSSLTTIGTVADGLAIPRGLGFAPAHPDELWTVNEATNGVVLYFDPGTSAQRSEARVDAYAQHFMSKVSSMSFGDLNHFASCQESRDDWDLHPKATDDYMGPTLWAADLDVFATVGQAYPHTAGAPEGSHIDMLHESPLCMGIAHEVDNVYWVFDGLNGHIVRYDFVKDHGPGGGNHSDGKIRRYPEATVTRMAGVASQLALDPGTGMLYIADTGAGRITRLDTRSGQDTGAASPPQHEALAEYTQVTGVNYEVLATDLGHPSGLLLDGDKLYVADVDTGDIIVLALSGQVLSRMPTNAHMIMGMTRGPDGKLYYVDAGANLVVRVDD